MAIKATIFKTQLQVADMDRHYYADHVLTVARHPSENDLRMMLRLVAFGLNAHERLVFCKGVSQDDEPDLWQKSLSDEIELWIDLGQPDEKRIRQACGRAKKVKIYTYQPRSARIWWEQIGANLQRFKNLSVYLIEEPEDADLRSLAQRNMTLQVSIQDEQIWIGNESAGVQLDVECWMSSEASL